MSSSQFNQADHHGGNDNVLTPPYILEALGPFDLDPCFGRPRPWNTAERMFCLEDEQDGLQLSWDGRVWLNQPYSNATAWARRMAGHNNGTMLVFARTETQWFQDYVFPVASGILFLRRRLNFFQPNGEPVRTQKGKISNAGAPSVLISYDYPVGAPLNLMRLSLALANGKLAGRLVRLWGQK